MTKRVFRFLQQSWSCRPIINRLPTHCCSLLARYPNSIRKLCRELRGFFCSVTPSQGRSYRFAHPETRRSRALQSWKGLSCDRLWSDQCKTRHLCSRVKWKKCTFAMALDGTCWATVLRKVTFHNIETDYWYSIHFGFLIHPQDYC